MKKLTTSIMTVSLLCLLSFTALAKEKDLKEHFTFHDDLRVGNTILEKGEYLVKYNLQTGEVSFKNLDEGEIVATAKATVKMNEEKFEQDALVTREGKLIALRLGGQREELIISEPIVAVLEVVPTCGLDVVINDDMESFIINDVDSMLPVEVTEYRITCLS
jgi:hypothetical protein